jgi:hypothetical protein
VERRDKWVLGIAIWLLAGSLLLAYREPTHTAVSHLIIGVEMLVVVRYAFKQSRNLGYAILVAFLVGYPIILSISSRNSLSTVDACTEYTRAYAVEPNLDPAAAAVVKALRSNDLNSLKNELDALSAELDNKYPEVAKKLLEGPLTQQFLDTLPQNAQNLIQNYGAKFVETHMKILELCSAVGG